MPVPWMRILKMTIGAAEIARRVRRRDTSLGDEVQRAITEERRGGLLETRLIGVVMSALREAFDRDHQRLEMERDLVEAQQERADRALRLELARQAADREVGRLHVLAGTAVASWIGALFFSTSFPPGTSMARIALGLGWLLLIGALAATFVARASVGRSLERLLRLEALVAKPAKSAPGDVTDWSADLSSASGLAGQAAPWLVVGGLTAIALSTLMR